VAAFALAAALVLSILLTAIALALVLLEAALRGARPVRRA
jgi:heme/copper-type cytochrome/quinol oxidase subunit 4